MSPTVEKVTESALLGEGPFWDTGSQSLYYVDIMGHSIHHYIPATKETFSAQLDEVVSLIIPVEGQTGKFIVSQKNKIVLISWDGKSSKIQSEEVIGLADPEPEKKDNRINDGKADPRGRLWAGTMIGNENLMTKGHGALYSVDNKIIKKRCEKIGLSNGLGWSLDGKTMYYIDTLEGSVDAFDYDLEKGLESNRRVLFDLAKNNIPGYPDGLTVDAEGKLWVAVFQGSRVLRIDPSNGTLITTVSLPAQKVTSVVFGGPNLDELYVTTAKEGLSEAEMKAEPDSGCVFRIKGLGVKGLPSVPVKL